MTLNQQKIENHVIIASLKSEKMGKLINRIPGSRLFISSLPGSALRTQASQYQQAFSKPCLVNLTSKDTHLVFSIYFQNLTLNTLIITTAGDLFCSNFLHFQHNNTLHNYIEELT